MTVITTSVFTELIQAVREDIKAHPELVRPLYGRATYLIMAAHAIRNVLDYDQAQLRKPEDPGFYKDIHTVTIPPQGWPLNKRTI